MSETERRSAERFNKRNWLATAKNRRSRQFIQTPFGHKLTVNVLMPLADFFAGKLDEKPDAPPPFLRKLIRQLNDHRFLALAGLAPLLDGIFRGWGDDDPSAGLKLNLAVGNDLYRRLCSEPKVTIVKPWDLRQRVRAGDWLIRQARTLDIFTPDGLPRISDKWLPYVAQLRESLIVADPAYAPLLKQPPPWTGWEKSSDEFPATFVRDWRPETKIAIDAAFLDPYFAHAGGVNALSKVALRIDPVMLDLVERFAVELIDNKGPQRRADLVTVAADVADARWIGARPVWNDYSCDRRGRVYALQHLNFARGDHVRSLFRFANGMLLDDTYWLEVHVANCEGSTDKMSRRARIEWVAGHRQDIGEIARDPIGTFDKWKGTDKPFAYVAACRELAAAWNDPQNFVTHLPIGFDGSANGLQHLALLAGDTVSAAMVNLLYNGNDDPSDAYDTLIARAIELIKADDCNHAKWWRERFKLLSAKQRRGLLKKPIMTFAYSVTLAGATLQIAKTYKSFRNEGPAKGAFRYLAEKVLEVCKHELRGPETVMSYLCAVAEHCADQGRYLEWTTPSGFPVSNRYQEPNIITVTCKYGGVRVAQHRVADGVTDNINRDKVLAAAAPNFVHSLDAAHLVMVVNGAVSEGITDLMTVHDCYYCLAPQATRLHQIILEQLAGLYRDNEPLSELRSRNVSGDILPVPPKGMLITHGQRTGGRHGGISLDTLIVTTNTNGDGYSTRISFSPDLVKKATNAFG